MHGFWHNYLYYPLLNTLFWLYSNLAGGNMGLAVIELTILLRVALLPFSILDERNRFQYEKLAVKIKDIEKEFKNDVVLRKEKVRELLKKHKVNYWNKVFVLGVQGLVLVLLYQVFMGGLRFTSEEALYAWIQVPSYVNPMFFNWDLGHRNVFWPLLVGGTVFIQTYLSMRRNHRVTKADLMYLMLFPIFTAVILLILPMVKSLFIFTSIMFSQVIKLVRYSLFSLRPEDQ